MSAELLGRDELRSFLRRWFDAGDGPTQVVAALYVYEYYHRDLPSHLRAARQYRSQISVKAERFHR